MPTNSNAGFWSGETLKSKKESLIKPFHSSQVDCAAYQLSVGSEVYVSPSAASVDPHQVTVRKLSDNEAFTIPPGQFAFILTEEEVTVPTDAIAFISMRAGIKFKGLVNVSGFHVDPGYRGQLTFAVYNAGPASIHLKRKQAIFLIWYTTLDCQSNYVKKHPPARGLDTKLITGIAGKLHSFESLSSRIEEIESTLNLHKALATFTAAVISALIAAWAINTFGPALQTRLNDQSTARSPNPSAQTDPHPHKAYPLTLEEREGAEE